MTNEKRKKIGEFIQRKHGAKHRLKIDKKTFNFWWHELEKFLGCSEKQLKNCSIQELIAIQYGYNSVCLSKTGEWGNEEYFDIYAK